MPDGFSVPGRRGRGISNFEISNFEFSGFGIWEFGSGVLRSTSGEADGEMVTTIGSEESFYV